MERHHGGTSVVYTLFTGDGVSGASVATPTAYTLHAIANLYFLLMNEF